MPIKSRPSVAHRIWIPSAALGTKFLDVLTSSWTMVAQTPSSTRLLPQTFLEMGYRESIFPYP